MPSSTTHQLEAKTSSESAFFGLLLHYGVTSRIVHTLQHHFELPPPYALDDQPKELAGSRPWIYLSGPTGTGKSTYAAYLLALYLRARTRLGKAEITLARLDPDNDSYDPSHRPRGSMMTGMGSFYHCVRVTELLRLMKADFSSAHREGALLFDRCLHAEFLILDDLTSQPSSWELTQLDLLIDYRYGKDTRTVITSNHPLNQLGKVLGSERIAGRIGEIARQRRLKRMYR